MALVAELVQALLHKDNDLRHKDAQLEALNAQLRAANALADGLRYQNLGRLRLANVVDLRGALDVMLKVQEQRGSSADAFATFLAKSPHAAAALQCCSLDARVLADNPHKPELSMEWLAAELARIKRRLNTDAHPKRTGQQYRDAGDRLLLTRNGLNESDVAILSCVLNSHGFPVEIVDATKLAAAGPAPAPSD